MIFSLKDKVQYLGLKIKESKKNVKFSYNSVTSDQFWALKVHYIDEFSFKMYKK